MKDSVKQDLSAGQRAHICSRILSAVELCFPHSLAGSDFETEDKIKEWLDDAMIASNRSDFARICQRGLASLKNGHTSFRDDCVMSTPFLGFHARTLADTAWTVTSSSRKDIEIGRTIVAINDQPMEAVFKSIAPFISASRDANARAITFYNSWLLPPDGTLTLCNGQTVSMTSSGTNVHHRGTAVKMFEIIDGRIGMLTIPDFGLQSSDAALAERENIEGCEALIVDLRGNGGGSTPMKLMRGLHPGRMPLWQEASILVSGLERASREKGVSGWPQPGRMIWPTEFALGDDNAFSGDMVILQDANTCSAAEDFVMPFKTSGRAHIMGERSAGSTGQPYFERLADDIWFRVAAKQVLWPDGTAFEGKGIAPDTEIMLTADDLVAGRDPVLEAAIDFLATTGKA
ncbi:S41 family peptidase [Cognatiyoonia sp. IB215446]|uniref:S41 family peptidase n=1 Tax=Cognatiyoonia sp. IB215446 TaxID=3097355 RepID=UPI002A0F3BFC|nr:S41 family peptidase [Cognatiyoonia sp. IB215446]MDX8346917.1 S41 family peptidase [Cognatiyoonia sp. IB215446]